MVSRRHCLMRADFLDKGTATQVLEKWGINYGDQMFYSSAKINAWFCSRKGINKMADFILDKVRNEKGFVNKIARATEKSGMALVGITKEIAAGNLGKLTNKQLASRFKKYVEAHYDYCLYFDISNSIREIGTQKLQDGLVKLLKATGEQNLINDYVNALIKPDKNPLTNKEQIDLKKIAANDEKALKNHAKKYEWLGVYNPDEPGLPLEYFKNRIKITENGRAKNKQLKKLAIPKNLKAMVKLMKKYVYLHTFRAEMLSKSYFLLKPFLMEVSRRWDTDLNSICAMTAGEIVTALDKNAKPDFFKIEKRKKSYLHLMKRGKIKIYSGVAAKEAFGKEIKKEEHLNAGGKIIKGLVVSQGMAQGRVRIIRKKEELSQIKKGEILVTPMTSPDYVLAMQKSAAIVTDEGGLLCHAAIISREMAKPCIVGTKNATAVLKNGDLIKVDAYKGIIKRYEAGKG